jgi:choline dehydrogenase-like flavoprotein
VNGGYFCRGLPTDFDDWRLPGWTWADVLPHFGAIETDLDFDSPLHGSEGSILVRRVSEFDGCTASFVRSVGRAGYWWIDDLNGSTPEEPLPTGVGAVPLNINTTTIVSPQTSPGLRRAPSWRANWAAVVIQGRSPNSTGKTATAALITVTAIAFRL